MYMAYELLSEPMKRFLDGLTAIHDGAGPYAEQRALGLTMRRAVEEARAGQATRDIGSLGKYRWANMVKDEQDVAMLALGTQGLGWSGPGFDDKQLERTKAFLTTRADSIWGGTNEVQLNVIAKRVLQLPE